MLLTRRNEGLETILREFVEELRARNEGAKAASGKGAKTKAKGKGKGKARE